MWNFSRGQAPRTAAGLRVQGTMVVVGVPTEPTPVHAYSLIGGNRRRAGSLIGVCTATVFKWAATGILSHVRIVNVIRVRAQDLTALLGGHSPSRR